MAQLVVRNIEASVKTRLKRRAQRRGHSMEEEVRAILRDAVMKEEESSTEGLGTAISSLFRKVGFDGEIHELRGHKIKPASFD
jgi:plasmid stability protein